MPIIDFHCDTIMKFMDKNLESVLKENNLNVDICKLKKANSIAQFFALFVELDKANDPLEYCLLMVDKFYEELEKNIGDIALATNYQELMDNMKKGMISAFLTIEEGGVLKGKTQQLRNFYKLGVRLLTLTWNFPNELGFPNKNKEDRSKGLTDFGIEVVSEMNNLGMIIDVSHLSDGGFYDVANYSKKPFVASHSNSRSISNHPRNLTDDMIKVLAARGGVMGICFEKQFLGSNEFSRVEDMACHISHIKNVGGIDCISIGSDFDGISNQGLEIKNIGEIEKLSIALNKNNFSSEEMDKIFYKNAIRVIKEVL
ncbi:dipeptidase [Clostridium sp. FP1]|uniref:dipeptidase n=1 Tax=Clostridium sp. FP1 TaxID=2724076 RepID=UPI0013E90362|nr:dipeptidase [Clostridium sp. FP1]MBZ9636258.1 dipeptidase [Clostridium sp. FP1]